MYQSERQQITNSVCGGILKNPEKYPSVIFKDERLYFCMRACLRVFEQDPQAFLDGEVEHPFEEDA